MFKVLNMPYCNIKSWVCARHFKPKMQKHFLCFIEDIYNILISMYLVQYRFWTLSSRYISLINVYFLPRNSTTIICIFNWHTIGILLQDRYFDISWMIEPLKIVVYVKALQIFSRPSWKTESYFNSHLQFTSITL